MNFLTRCKYVGPVGRNGKKYVTDFDTYLDAVLKGQVEKNPKNRALDLKHVQNIKDNWDFNSFGEVIGIELQTKNGLVFQQRSSHHRNEALKLLATERKGLGSDGKISLYINVFPTDEAVRMYVTEGNAKRLYAHDLLGNDDYAYCNLMKPILGAVDLQPHRGASFFTAKGLTTVAGIILTISRNPSAFNTFSFKSVLRNAKEVKELAGIPQGDPAFDVKLSPKSRQSLIDAINYAVDVAHGVIDQGDLLKGKNKTSKLSEQAASVLRCKTFFVFLIWDKVTGGQVTSILADTLAKTLTVKEAELITNAMNALNNKDTATFSDIIYKIARTKTGYIRQTNAGDVARP